MGVIVGGGEIPYNEQARRVKEDNAANWVTRDPEVKCFMPGVPRATYLPHPFQVIQSENDFFIAYQFAGAVRDIYMDDPGPAPLDSWMGWSVGHWEGDTLVVEVTGLHDGSWLDRAGSHHSYQMKVTERYTLMGPTGTHRAIHHQDADLSTHGTQRPHHGFSLRRVRRRADLR
jgi:hypothetical protein